MLQFVLATSEFHFNNLHPNPLNSPILPTSASPPTKEPPAHNRIQTPPVRSHNVQEYAPIRGHSHIPLYVDLLGRGLMSSRPQSFNKLRTIFIPVPCGEIMMSTITSRNLHSLLNILPGNLGLAPKNLYNATRFSLCGRNTIRHSFSA